jgi:hypothetical protein
VKRFIGTGRHVDFEEEVVSSTEKKCRGVEGPEFSQSQAKVGRWEKDGSDFSDLTQKGKGEWKGSKIGDEEGGIGK